jgi:putative transcriptional regulator
LKKTKKILAGIGFLALAGLFFWIPHHLKQPGPASHKLLVATEKMAGSGFDKAVILVLEQDSYGAKGVVLNRPPVTPGAYPPGGPVEPESYYTLHTLDLSSKLTSAMPEIDVGGTPGDMFLLLIEKMGDKPKRHKTFRGYASWGWGQLPQEIEDGKWKVVVPTTNFIFGAPQAGMWNAAMKLPKIAIP